MRARLRTLLKPLNKIVLWWSDGFQGVCLIGLHGAERHQSLGYVVFPILALRNKTQQSRVQPSGRLVSVGIKGVYLRDPLKLLKYLWSIVPKGLRSPQLCPHYIELDLLSSILNDRDINVPSLMIHLRFCFNFPLVLEPNGKLRMKSCIALRLAGNKNSHFSEFTH